jgi:hypothetical protein
VVATVVDGAPARVVVGALLPLPPLHALAATTEKAAVATSATATRLTPTSRSPAPRRASLALRTPGA